MDSDDVRRYVIVRVDAGEAQLHVESHGLTRRAAVAALRHAAREIERTRIRNQERPYDA